MNCVNRAKKSSFERDPMTGTGIRPLSVISGVSTNEDTNVLKMDSR
jgi:hypothetical protein